MFRKRTSLGLKPNIESLLCYAGLFVSGLFFYFFEEENKFVRFHAIQSVIVFGGILLLELVLRIFLLIPLLGFIVWRIFSGLLGIFAFILWLFLLIKAYKGKQFKLPIVGAYATKYA